jgi:hypothetical protein
MHSKDKDEYRTTNLYLASALEASGFSIIRFEGNFPNQAIFVFQSEKKDIHKAVQDYHSDKLLISARHLLFIQKDLKDRLWERSKSL